MFEKIRKSRATGECHSREALTYLFYCFSYMGLILPQKYKILYCIYSVFLNINCVILTPLVFNLGILVDLHNLSIGQILTSLQATFNNDGIPIKIITIAIFMRRLQSADQILDELDARCKRPEEQDELRRVVMIGNRMIMIYHLVYHGYGCSTFASTISAGQPPFSLYNPFFNWRDSHSNLCLQILYEALYLHFALVNQVANDCYPAVYICIIRAHLRILAKRLRRLGTVPEMTKEQNYEELVQCIKDHKNILRLLGVVTPVMSITLFVQFLCMGLVCCTTMINILIFADASMLLASSFYVMTVALQTSPSCFQASYLIHDGDDIPVAIFQSNWIDQDQKYRKMLIFFQHSTQKPIELTALKIFIINLNTNLNIAKFSFSMYTLVKNMDFGQPK